MLLTVKDACELHPMALEYAMSEQVENLSDVRDASPQKAHEFFAKNYVTKGMETLLNQGLRRLGGKSDQAVFELKQAMGGGKTHSMIALGLLARDSSLRTEIIPEIAQAAAFGDAKLVAVEGRSGFEERFGVKSPINSSPLRAVLFALYELRREVDIDEAIGHLRDLVHGYLSRREDLMALASVIASKRVIKAPGEAEPARILFSRIKNERLG